MIKFLDNFDMHKNKINVSAMCSLGIAIRIGLAILIFTNFASSI